MAIEKFPIGRGATLRELEEDPHPLLARLRAAEPVSWLAVDRDARTGKITERPTRDTIPVAVQEQLIVELYSK